MFIELLIDDYLVDRDWDTGNNRGLSNPVRDDKLHPLQALEENILLRVLQDYRPQVTTLVGSRYINVVI